MKKALRRALFCSPKPLRHGRASTVQCCRILLRKSLVRGWRASGLLKKSSLEQSSRILPPTSMKITRLLTLRAKPISWVTHIMVMPSLARPTMTSSTSPTISGSSAEVGSSNSITMGSIDSARAMATRCCWPPESWPGNLSLCAIRPTRSSIFRPRFLGSCSAIPSTVISPFWKGSSALMVLISVDLPEPEGPHTTTTSPFWMVAVHSLSTCTGPYHLDTFLSSIISFSSIQSLLHQHRSADDRDLLVQALDRPGQRVAHDEVQNRSGQVCLDRTTKVLARHFKALEHVVGTDGVDQRRVLEQDDGLREQHRQHVAERLGQHHQLHVLAVRHAQRLAGIHLAAWDGLDASAHDFAEVGRFKGDEGNDRRHFRANGAADGGDEREQQAEIQPFEHEVGDQLPVVEGEIDIHINAPLRPRRSRPCQGCVRVFR